ncbi:hypothetical protein WDH52_19830 [Streptomyces sp. TRM70308]|uniref:hypothetical protein n=1 Tax=Streptomyces sp. TRM70308 TaxID=3131932 RepID=UPI003D081D4A
MWPGQQQPGGGQNPQEPNPYQQPGGYGRPNPYQQPGGQQPGYPGQGAPAPQQPGPYPQPGHPPGQPPWGPPTAPAGPPPPDGGRPKNATRNTILAIAVSLAVIAGAVVTGVWMLSDDEGGGRPTAGGSPSASPSASPSESAEPTDDPDADDGEPQPVVDGWQVVVNGRHNSAFDVPGEWEPATEDTIVGWGEAEDSEDALIPAPAVAMSAPAFLEEDWCRDSDEGTYSRAVVGTKGAQGAKNTEEAALAAAQNFVFHRHGGEDKELVDWTESEPFSNDHGIEGHIATATHTGGEKTNKCQADGKSVAISWLDDARDLRLWVLVSDTGVEDEVPQEVIDQMTASLRPYTEGDGEA